MALILYKQIHLVFKDRMLSIAHVLALEEENLDGATPILHESQSMNTGWFYPSPSIVKINLDASFKQKHPDLLH